MKRRIGQLVGRLQAAVQGLSPRGRRAVSLLAMLAAALGALVFAWAGRPGVAVLGALGLAAQLLIHLDTFHGLRPRWPSCLRRRGPIRIRQRPR